MSTASTPPAAPSPPLPALDIHRAYVVGHTHQYAVNVPGHPKLTGDHRDDTYMTARFGTYAVHRMVSALHARYCRTNPPRAPAILYYPEAPARAGYTDGVPEHTYWKMLWEPTEATDGKVPEWLRIEASRNLRIQGEPDTEALPGAAPGGGWVPLSFRGLPAGRPADRHVAVCACVEAAAEELPAADDLIPPKPAGQPGVGLALLHLTAVRRLDEPRRKAFAALVCELCGRAERAIVIVGDRALNHLGFPITDDSSWEAFADALLTDRRWAEYQKEFEVPISAWNNVQLIVRHKSSGAVRAVFDRRQSHYGQFLHYLIDAGDTTPAQTGFLRGHNSILGASIFGHLVCRPDEAYDDCIRTGIEDGLRRCMQFEKTGFLEKVRTGRRPDSRAAEALFRDETNAKWRFGCVRIPRDEALRRTGPLWSAYDVLVRDTARQAGGWTAFKDRDGTPSELFERTYRVARCIVREGLNETVSRYEMPVVRFGKMIITDRAAFEQVREIQAAMRSYLASIDKQSNPLCLGVFGAPGGGTSWGIKQLAESLQSDLFEKNPHELNLSQLSAPRDLEPVFRRVRDATLQKKVPLVFFDEFDTDRDGPFSWLKTFLAPMQDGRFGERPDAIEFRHGIFVFIGGVNHTFAMFNGRARDREFIAAKGPDFVSRLSRYFDVLGISSERDGDYTYLVRRAVVLRDLLFRYHPPLFPDGKDGVAQIDDEVVSALLRVQAFRHGVRSLEAIVKTSRLSPDQPRLHLASLPPDWQLDMHLDLADYYRVRAWRDQRVAAGAASESV